MALELAPPDEHQLPKSPLTLVVCQVRFEQLPEISDARKALALHEALGGRRGKYAKMEQIQSSSFAASMGPNVPVALSKVGDQQGWRFRSEDSSWLVSVFPDQASLETQPPTPTGEPTSVCGLTSCFGPLSPRSHQLLDSGSAFATSTRSATQWFSRLRSGSRTSHQRSLALSCTRHSALVSRPLSSNWTSMPATICTAPSATGSSVTRQRTTP